MSAERKPTRQARAFVTALTLAASPCVDMSRCRRSSSHSRARNACVLFLFLSIRRSHHLFLSALFKSFSNGKSYYGTSYPNRWWVSHCPLCWSVILSHFLTEFIGELKDEFQRSFVVKYSDKANSPLKNVEKKLDNKVRTQQHLKLTQSGS